MGRRTNVITNTPLEIHYSVKRVNKTSYNCFMVFQGILDLNGHSDRRARDRFPIPMHCAIEGLTMNTKGCGQRPAHTGQMVTLYQS